MVHSSKCFCIHRMSSLLSHIPEISIHSNKIPHNPAPINTLSFFHFSTIWSLPLVGSLLSFHTRQNEIPRWPNARCTRRGISASMLERRCCAMPMANVWMKTRRGDTAFGGGFPRRWCFRLLARNWRNWCNWDNFGHVFFFECVYTSQCLQA